MAFLKLFCPLAVIYDFRSAKGTWIDQAADATLTLSTSFRFNNEVADVANAILACKGEQAKLKGGGRAGSIYRPLRKDQPLPRGALVLHRTNKGISESNFTNIRNLPLCRRYENAV